MPYQQLQLLNIKTMTADSSLMVPKGTPTCSLVRKEGRPRGHGVITVDCSDEAELVDMACFLVARNQIVKALRMADDVLCHLEVTSPHPLNTRMHREVQAAIFMATGEYAPGAGPAQPITIDLWRRRNGMVPKWGHLTESEIRQHVKIMDEGVGRQPDPNEPFEGILGRYVAQLQEDAKKFDAAEARMMGPLLRELEAGYVIDRGEISDHSGAPKFAHSRAMKGLPEAAKEETIE